MAHAHSHSHAREGRMPPAPRRVRVALGLAVAPFLLVTVVGLVVLRPAGDPAKRLASPDLVAGGERYDATVVEVTTLPCAGPVLGQVVGPHGEVGADGQAAQCRQATVELEDGPEVGRRYDLELSGADFGPQLSVGDAIVVNRVDLGTVSYGFDDFQRRTPLGLLAVLFAVIVVAVARWRGLAALIGLAISGAVLVWFVIPAILDGRNAVAVGLVGGSAIIFVILYVAHGFNVRTTTALLGTLASLVVTAVLAVAFVAATRLTGQSDEAATTLLVAGSQVNLSGLILAGILIGTVGVLNDVTVTQASAAWEIHQANPLLGPRKVFVAGMRVGRDHIASVVDTLFLAYAGAALPLLIVFFVADRRFLDVLSSETVAKEVVGTLVGSIGLVASVPLTTLLAAVVAARVVAPAPVDEDADAAVPPDAAQSDEGAPDEEASEGGVSDGGVSDGADAPGGSSATPPAARKQRRSTSSAAARRRRSPDGGWSPPRAEREFWDEG